MNGFIKDNMGHLPQQEQRAMKYYLYQLHARKGSGEYGLYKVSDNFLYGKKPTMDIMVDLDKRVGVAVAFGDADYLNVRISTTRDELVSDWLES